MPPRLPHPRLHEVAVVALTAGLFAGLAHVGLLLRDDASGVAPVWLANAVLLGMMLRSARGRWLWLMLGCFAANVGVNLAHAVPAALGMGFSVINQIEVATAAALLAQRGRALDLSAMDDLLRFSAVAGLAAPVVSGLFATAMLAGAGVAWSEVLPGWIPTSALGLLIGTPMVIALTDAARGRRPWRAGAVEAAAVLALGLGATGAVFVLGNGPFLFLIGPLVVLTAFGWARRAPRC